jgi:hypothetical protein
MCCCPDYADGATGAATQASQGAANAVADVVLRAGMERAGESGEFEEVVEAVEAARHVEWQAQTDLARDIFGNPFRPATVDPAWRTSTVVALARGMYESRDFGAMPILADALQDAGCDNEDILNHCRGPGPHIRGCWVVDLVLGKE